MKGLRQHSLWTAPRTTRQVWPFERDKQLKFGSSLPYKILHYLAPEMLQEATGRSAPHAWYLNRASLGSQDFGNINMVIISERQQ